MNRLHPQTLARMIDHTMLKPDTVAKQVHVLCDEALEYGFRTVCVAPMWVRFGAELLGQSGIGVAAVVGFPHGNTLPSVKAYEADKAIAEGAIEVDMVINIGALKGGDTKLVEADISGVVRAAGRGDGALVKVIVETAYLSDDQKVVACEILEAAGANYVKTSTGFAETGATVKDVALFKSIVEERLGIKAAGGIRTLETAEVLIGAGATRIGCSSSVSIMKECLASHGERKGRERVVIK